MIRISLGEGRVCARAWDPAMPNEAGEVGGPETRLATLVLPLPAWSYSASVFLFVKWG